MRLLSIMIVMERDDRDGCESDGDGSEDYWHELKQYCCIKHVF